MIDAVLPSHTSLKLRLTQLDQCSQGVGTQFGEPTFITPDDAGSKCLLTLNHFIDLFLKRPRTNVFVDLYVACLPDTECAVSRLILHSRIPPSIKMENVIRIGEVQADAACFKR